MKNEHVLLKGTLILTLSGFLTKIIGFLYRIFLSQTIGAQGMGIYQLIFPIHTLCFALTVGGIQTAISRFVATRAALKDEQGARDIFFLATTLSMSLSFFVTFLLFRHASWFYHAGNNGRGGHARQRVRRKERTYRLGLSGGQRH